ncbi:MAG: glycosyltransferase family 39 protein [Patescibacteria group bacterium]
MNVTKPKIILVVIIIIAAFLRFYQLGNNPSSLTWDEAAWGYNAYSLGIDGKDEFGRFLPLDYLESFGDFKPPLYAYLDIIPIKIFGLNEFATRFPSAFFGVLTVLVTYFLVRRIFSFSRNSPPRSRFATSRGWPNGLPRGESVALLSAFLLVISPWHINLSRAAFEANVASFFIVAGVWLFLAAIQNKKWLLLLSVSSFVLSIYTFNTARIVSPILFILLSLIFWKALWRIKYQVVGATIVGIVLILPIARFLVSPQASLRFKEVNIFSDIEVIERTNQEIENDKNIMWSRILHNRRFAYAVEYIKHYLDNVSPSFLFLKGDGNPKFSTQDVGQMYLWELPFFIGGILLLFRRREGNWWIVPLWLLIGIVPAATARETPHALRIETTLPTFQIIVAYGIYQAVSSIKYYVLSKNKRYVILSSFILLLFVNFLYYIHGYYAHYPREYSGEWQYGYKESIEYVKMVQDKYDQIRITSAMGRPYVYYAFFTKTFPESFRKTAIVKRDAFGFVTVSGFLKYRFADNLNFIKEKTKKALYIDIPGRVHPKGDILKRFYLLNGAEVLVAYRL